MGAEASTQPLLEAPARLQPLLAGEQRALALLKERKQIDLATNDLLADDPRNAAAWPEERQLRGSFLTWLVLEAQIQNWLPANRVLIRGVNVCGQLDLSFRTTEMALLFRQCNVSTGMNFSSARCRGLQFDQVILGSVNAWSIVIDGLLRLDRVTLVGLLHLTNARITGDFIISQSKIETEGIVAVNAPGLEVNGAVNFDASSFNGRLHLIGARVTGDLVIANGAIRCRFGNAISADNIKISGRCFIRDGMKIDGTLRLFSARIEGELNLRSTKIVSVEEYALDARNARVGGAVYLSGGFSANGRVGFYGAEIAGELTLDGASIRPQRDVALDIESSRINGAVRLGGGFSASGAVLLYGATINGDLNCQGANISTSFRYALDGRRSSLKGAALLTEGFTANKLVTFYGASVVSDIVVSKADIDAPQALEVSAVSATGFRLINSRIRGGIELVGASFSGSVEVKNSQIDGRRNFALRATNLKTQTFALGGDKTEIIGGVMLYGASIDGDINIQDCTLVSRDAREENVVFSANSARCEGTMRWYPMRSPVGTLYLENAYIAAVDDDLEKWPARLRLDGLKYHRLLGGSPHSIKERLKWLERQDRYYSQPFEQLMATYRVVGDLSSAADVAISKWRRRRESLGTAARAWDGFLDFSSGYGYRPWRPLVSLIVLIMLGILVYHWGYSKGVFCPADSLKPAVPGGQLCLASSAYPQFHSALYSIETLLPIGDFGERRLYVIRADNAWSSYIELYSIFHRFFGWMFALLLALAPTNVLKRE